MKKILFGLCIIFSCVSVYAGALDDLMVEKQAEKAKAAERSAQQKQAKQQQLADIADCEQAVAKALENKKSISDREIKVFNSGTVFLGADNLFAFTDYKTKFRVVDFASDGIFVEAVEFFLHYPDDVKGKYFIYTSDTDYATNEYFKDTNTVYEKVGNYKYTTITGATNSVPAYRATSLKVSEINPKTYLKNKKLSCCQYIEPDKTGFKEVGIATGYGIQEEADISSKACHTTKHKNGVDSLAIYTGTNYSK